MKNRIAIALAVAGLSLWLAACGNSATQTPQATAPNAAATATPTVLVAAPTEAPATLAPAATEPVATSQPAGQPADARIIIAAAIDALDKHGPYRMKITSSLDANPVVMDVVPPDRSYYKSSVDGKPVEIISIGATSYVLDPDGKWQTVASQDAGVDKPLVADAEALNSLKDITALGNKTVNGVDAAGYTFVDSTAPNVTTTLWIDAQGKPVQMVTVENGAQTTYDIAYDASIKIEAPAK